MRDERREHNSWGDNFQRLRRGGRVRQTCITEEGGEGEDNNTEICVISGGGESS